MAEVEINESLIRVRHQSSSDGSTQKMDNGKEQQPTVSPAASVDVDAIIDLCVERVFEMLKEKNDR